MTAPAPSWRHLTLRSLGRLAGPGHHPAGPGMRQLPDRWDMLMQEAEQVSEAESDRARRRTDVHRQP